jgi:hypothetical protein
MEPTCDRPPNGWVCKLPRNHDGPCPTWRQPGRLATLLRRIADRLEGEWADWPHV